MTFATERKKILRDFFYIWHRNRMKMCKLIFGESLTATNTFQKATFISCFLKFIKFQVTISTTRLKVLKVK